jgi:CubicO group peptidase (beta-lactamase class C family)
MMKLAAVALLAVFALVGCASTPSVSPMTSVGDGRAQSQAVFDELLNPKAPGCSAAVAIKGEVVWAAARGMADLAASRPLDTKTRFDIASVSKQFTAVAILLLQQDGLLDTADSLAVHLDGLPAWSRHVTIDDLLHHTSGIPDYTVLLAQSGVAITEKASQADAVTAIAEVNEIPSGGGFEYSNSNYVLLAELVENSSGTTLAEFLQARVFGPSNLDMVLEPAREATDTALSYFNGEPEVSGWTQMGDGSIFTSPSELARWGDNYRTGTVGGTTLVAEMTRSPVDTGAPDNSRYGTGLVVAPDGTLSHGGGWVGFVTIFIGL